MNLPETLMRRDRIWTLESRRAFHQLPLVERRRQLAQQAKLIVEPSMNLVEHQERAMWQGGDIADE